MKLIENLLILFILFFNCINVFALLVNNVDASEELPQKGPHLSCVSQNSIIVSWRTETLDSSVVQYGLAPGYGSEVKDTDMKMAHSLTLTGLLPDTIYHYRVLFEEKQTPDYTFRTTVPFEKQFKFNVYGDTRTQPDSHLVVVNRIMEFEPYFTLHTGDVVENGYSQSDWDIYFATICSSEVCAQEIPFYYAIGNHENESPLYYGYFYLPHNNPDSTESYYSFDYGNSHFISLDTEIPYGPTSHQYNWLETDLRSTYDKIYVFVFMHQYPYCAGGHESNIALRNALCPLFEEYKVDMVFSGHSHFYQRNGPINGVTYMITAGGGAPLRTPAESSWTQYTEESHHNVTFTVWSDSLMFRMVRTDGSVGDNLVYHPKVKPQIFCGDLNRDGSVEISDVVYLVNYLFKGGDSPQCNPPYFHCGDANGDEEITISDGIYLINYLFKLGPEPIC
ncbi:MAG: metallophosphoesterase [Candidatus Zixiibacteriota bacterium]